LGIEGRATAGTLDTTLAISINTNKAHPSEQRFPHDQRQTHQLEAALLGALDSLESFRRRLPALSVRRMGFNRCLYEVEMLQVSGLPNGDLMNSSFLCQDERSRHVTPLESPFQSRP